MILYRHSNFLILLFWVLIVPRLSKETDENSIENIPSDCDNFSVNVLQDLLGPAYNSRYMSIEQPNYNDKHLVTGGANEEIDAASRKRGTSPKIGSFYVDNTYAVPISNKPAWEKGSYLTEPIEENADTMENGKSKRSLADIFDLDKILESHIGNAITGRGKDIKHAMFLRKGDIERPWRCEAMVRWIDLGVEYFPRYLRTVECMKNTCWYGHYECVPRSFTVKILRRKHGKCMKTIEHNFGNIGLPNELKQLWIWEERAVNFCCDCSIIPTHIISN